MNSNFLGFLGLSTLFPELRGSLGFCLFYPPAPWSRNSLKVTVWGSHRVYLVCFLFPKDSTLPVLSVLNTVVSHISVPVFICFREESRYDSFFIILSGISLYLKRIPFRYYLKHPLSPWPPHFRNLTQAKYSFIPTVLLPFTHLCSHLLIMQ